MLREVIKVGLGRPAFPESDPDRGVMELEKGIPGLRFLVSVALAPRLGREE